MLFRGGGDDERKSLGFGVEKKKMEGDGDTFLIKR